MYLVLLFLLDSVHSVICIYAVTYLFGLSFSVFNLVYFIHKYFEPTSISTIAWEKELLESISNKEIKMVFEVPQAKNSIEKKEYIHICVSVKKSSNINFSSSSAYKVNNVYQMDNLNIDTGYSIPYYLPVPASQKMNSIIMLYMDAFYAILIIFIVVLVFLLYFVFYNHQLSNFFNIYYFLYRLHLFRSNVKVSEYDYVYRNLKYPYNYSKEEEHIIDFFIIVIPTVIVLELMIPSLGYLYNEEAIFFNSFIDFDVNIIGNQWYWTYEYVLEIGIDENITSWHSNYEPSEIKQLIFSFDSILLTDSYNNRLLDVDKPLVLPVHTNVLLSFTSRDVIHSWSLPQMGIKVDCIPGKITNTLFCSYSTGIFYGQCSELCGVLHGFMPICVEVVSYDDFFIWFIYNYNKYCLENKIKSFSYYEEVLKLLGDDIEVVYEAYKSDDTE